MNLSPDGKPTDSWGFDLLVRFVWEVITDAEIVVFVCQFIGHAILVVMRLLLAALLP